MLQHPRSRQSTASTLQFTRLTDHGGLCFGIRPNLKASIQVHDLNTGDFSLVVVVISPPSGLKLQCYLDHHGALCIRAVRSLYSDSPALYGFSFGQNRGDK